MGILTWEGRISSACKERKVGEAVISCITAYCLLLLSREVKLQFRDPSFVWEEVEVPCFALKRKGRSA